jgi:hypothetical protein
MRATFERVRPAATWPVYFLCLIITSPVIAAAQVNTYLCLSLSGSNPVYLTVDNSNKSVRLEQSSNGGIKCILFMERRRLWPDFHRFHCKSLCIRDGK